MSSNRIISPSDHICGGPKNSTLIKQYVIELNLACQGSGVSCLPRGCPYNVGVKAEDVDPETHETTGSQKRKGWMMRKGTVKDARVKNIVCIGAGYVGGPSMAVLADRCRNKKVTVVDVDAAKIRAWKGSKLPIFEPGLDKIVKRTRGKNLFFSTDIPGEIERADMIFVCVNTPTKAFGHGEGYASDMQYVEKTARMILRHARPETIVVEKSTVPVRTAEAIERIFCSGATEGKPIEVLSNPEFLAEGTAVRDLE